MSRNFACAISRRRKKVSAPRFQFDSDDAEALNGLGLAQIQRGRPREAAQYFAAATRAQPDYAPALLNLATVARQYLRDDALALRNYRAYLALTPRRADWDQVNAIANDLDQEVNGAANPSRSNHPAVSAGSQMGERRAPPVARTQTSPRPFANSPGESPTPEDAETENPATPEANPFVAAETPPRQANEGPGVLHQFNPLNWFRSASPEPKVTQLASANANGNRVTPASEPGTRPAATVTPVFNRATKPFRLVQPAPPPFPRYLYLSPSSPQPGDRPAAGHAFARAQQFERDERYQTPWVRIARRRGWTPAGLRRNTIAA